MSEQERGFSPEGAENFSFPKNEAGQEADISLEEKLAGVNEAMAALEADQTRDDEDETQLEELRKEKKELLLNAAKSLANELLEDVKQFGNADTAKRKRESVQHYMAEEEPQKMLDGLEQVLDADPSWGSYIGKDINYLRSQDTLALQEAILKDPTYLHDVELRKTLLEKYRGETERIRGQM
jgi:hypothetical protein